MKFVGLTDHATLLAELDRLADRLRDEGFSIVLHVAHESGYEARRLHLRGGAGQRDTALLDAFRDLTALRDAVGR